MKHNGIHTLAIRTRQFYWFSLAVLFTRYVDPPRIEGFRMALEKKSFIIPYFVARMFSITFGGNC